LNSAADDEPQTCQLMVERNKRKDHFVAALKCHIAIDWLDELSD
jgi:hypothetical protein